MSLDWFSNKKKTKEKSEQETNEQTGPWEPAVPYLKHGLSEIFRRFSGSPMVPGDPFSAASGGAPIGGLAGLLNQNNFLGGRNHVRRIQSQRNRPQGVPVNPLYDQALPFGARPYRYTPIVPQAYNPLLQDPSIAEAIKRLQGIAAPG